MHEYRNSRFEMKEIKDWNSKGLRYRITDLETDSSELWLPDTYSGGVVESWDMEETEDWQTDRSAAKQTFPEVRVLHIPKGLLKIRIRNDLFPNLERVEIDAENENFSTDGRLIFADESESYYGKKGKWLKYCPVCKGEVVVIPKEVKRICARAFSGTRYSEILFSETGPGIDIDLDAFEGSAWLESRTYPIVIGDMLYKIDPKADCLEIPKEVRRIHEKVFGWNCAMRKMISPFLPNLASAIEINQAGCLRSLELTSAQASVNLRALRKLENLEEISIIPGHKRYLTRDGVLFSADQKRLLYYPVSKRDTSYTIPDGVQKIEESAFAFQKFLKEVVMPESVCSIGTRAFYACKSLCRVCLSPNIREIPDSNAYQKGGVFEACVSLEQIKMPMGLNYLGSFAFYKSGLREITLNSRLQQIGEYALMAERLKVISIPESVKRVGKGSFFYASHIYAYEGSARGLISAVNTVEPDTKDKSVNVVWSRCEITVLHKRSDRREELLIPGSLARSAAYHLDVAWNNEKIDYEEYDECLGQINNSEEKLEFARRGILHHRAGEENVYTDYIRRMSYKIGSGLLEEGKEKEFLNFLKMDYLSSESLAKLIKISNQRGMTVCSAYIMERQNKKERKRAGFRL